MFRVDPATSQTRVLRRADWTGTNSFPSDLKLSEQDECGIETRYTYDSLKRVVSVTKTGVSISGYPVQGNITETVTYDASDRVLSRTKSGGALTLTSSSAYDRAGRVRTTVDEAGFTNKFGYHLGGRQVSQTNSAGETTITLNYLDRRVASVTGTAQVNEFYDYSLTPLAYADLLYPKNTTTKTIGATNSTRWTSTMTDQRYKPASEEKPGFRSSIVVSNTLRIWSPRGHEYYANGPTDYTQSDYTELNEYGAKAFNRKSVKMEIPGPTPLTQYHSFSTRFETNASGHWFTVSDEYQHPRACT